MIRPAFSGLSACRGVLRARLALLGLTATCALSAGCSSYFGAGPDPSRDGRVDAGAAGAGNAQPIVLASGVSVNDLVLDADHVYFTSGQGLAKVAKSGGNPVPLGGFSQLNGLAVDAAALYAVNSSGALFSVRKDGTGTKTLASSMCAGGSGAVVLDASHVFFSTGPYLRSTSLGDGTTQDLSSDVWQAGGPATAARIAFDAQNVYYVGNPSIGGQGALYGVARASATAASCMGLTQRGTQVAAAQGTIAALIGAGGRLYFTDLTSNGLSPVLAVSAILSPSLSPSAVTSLAKLDFSGNNGPSAGSALTADASYLYFGGFSGIYRVLIGGPACKAAPPCADPELLVGGVNATALAVDEAFLYYGDQNGPSGVKKIPK
jgi:hypothetical protein